MHVVQQRAVHRTHLGIQLSVGGSTLDIREPILLYFPILRALSLGKVKFLQFYAGAYALRQYRREQCAEHG